MKHYNSLGNKFDPSARKKVEIHSIELKDERENEKTKEIASKGSFLAHYHGEGYVFTRSPRRKVI